MAKGNKKGHSFTRRICSWQYCAHCGLVALNNETTRKLIRQPCKGHEE